MHGRRVNVALALALLASSVAHSVTGAPFDGSGEDDPVTLSPNLKVCNNSDTDPMCSVTRDTVRNPNKTEGKDWESLEASDNGEWYGISVQTLNFLAKARWRSIGNRGSWITLPPRMKICKTADSDPVCSVIQDIVDNPNKTKTNHWEKVGSTNESKGYSFSIPSFPSELWNLDKSEIILSSWRRRYRCNPFFDVLCLFIRYIMVNPNATRENDWKYLVSSGDDIWYIATIASKDTPMASGPSELQWMVIPTKTKICRSKDETRVCSYLQNIVNYPRSHLNRDSKYEGSRSGGEVHSIPTSIWYAEQQMLSLVPDILQNMIYICNPPCCDPVCGILLDIKDSRRNTGTEHSEYLVATGDGYWSRFSVLDDTPLESLLRPTDLWEKLPVPSDPSKVGEMATGFIGLVILIIIICFLISLCRRLRCSRESLHDTSDSDKEGLSLVVAARHTATPPPPHKLPLLPLSPSPSPSPQELRLPHSLGDEPASPTAANPDHDLTSLILHAVLVQCGLRASAADWPAETGEDSVVTFNRQ